MRQRVKSARSLYNKRLMVSIYSAFHMLIIINYVAVVVHCMAFNNTSDMRDAVIQYDGQYIVWSERQ